MGAVMLALAAIVAVTVGTGRCMALAAQAGGEVAEIVAKTRAALGGERRLAALTTLTAEGPFRRLGSAEIRGTVRLTLGVPDRIRHEEQFDVPTGARVTRVGGLDGEHVWEDTSTSGGVAGGQIVIRGSGPGRGAGPADPEQVRQAQRRRLTAILQRMTLALLAHGDALSYAGIAEVGDGEAYVLERTDQAGRPVRLFVSRETSMPLAISYTDIGPIGAGGRGMMGMGGGGRAAGGRGGRGQVQQPSDAGPGVRQFEEPALSTIVMRLDDYRVVDGIRLPHLFVQSMDGAPIEEWTVRRYRVNPQVNARVFERK
jgi:hypothetical protein